MPGNFYVQDGIELIPAFAAFEHFAVLPALVETGALPAFLGEMLNFFVLLMRKVYVCSSVV